MRITKLEHPSDDVLLVHLERVALVEGTIQASAHVLKFDLEGDCCSTSAFDAQTGDEVAYMNSLVDERTGLGLVGFRLINQPDGYKDTAEIEHYGIEFKTTKHSTTLMWRNESNGYYSGWCEVFFDGVLIPKSEMDAPDLLMYLQP